MAASLSANGRSQRWASDRPLSDDKLPTTQRGLVRGCDRNRMKSKVAYSSRLLGRERNNHVVAF